MIIMKLCWENRVRFKVVLKWFERQQRGVVGLEFYFGWKGDWGEGFLCGLEFGRFEFFVDIKGGNFGFFYQFIQICCRRSTGSSWV